MDTIDNKVTEVTSDTSANPETEMFAYNFRVKLENGEDLKFRVPSNVILMDSPLKGYKSANGTRPMLDTTNRLVYSPLDKSIWRRMLIFCGASLLVGLLIGAGVMFSIGKVSTIFDQNPGVPTVTEQEEQVVEEVAEVKETKEEVAPVEANADSAKAEEKPAVEPVKATAVPDEKVQAAVKYLEETPVWNRTAMEEHAALKGLWDALNTRSFRKILDKKYDCLNGSAKFKQLRTVAKQLTSKTWTSNYTSPGDEDITIDPYIKKLEALAAPAN
ncbi:MAG: hypothetical protein IKW11_07880 [Bacteroidales bacterium]|nr:hypothetical protein [Bacteroidales bacterium]